MLTAWPNVFAEDVRDSGQTRTLTLQNASALVRAQNPALVAARYRVAEARGRLRQAGRLSNPEVEAGFQHDPQWREFSRELALSQAFPVTERLRHEKDVSLAELQAAEAEIEDFERRLVGDVRGKVVDILALDGTRKVQVSQVNAVIELLTFIESQVAKAEGSILDAQEVRLDKTRLGLAMRQTAIEREQAVNALKPVLGLAPNQTLLVSGELPPIVVQASSEAVARVESRADYRAAGHLAEAASREVLLERARRFDDLSVRLFIEHAREEDAPNGLEHEAAVGVGVSIPIPFWNKNEGAIDEKQAKHARLMKEREAVANQARHEVSGAQATMAAQATLLNELDTTLVPAVMKQIDDLQRAYTEGLAELPAVLRARRQVVDLEATRLETLRAYHRARVQLETALGNP